MANIRNGFHSFITQELVDNILFQKNNFYYFLGKIDPWPDGETPLINIDTEESDLSSRDGILYIRKVNPTETTIVTKSFIWENGAVYDQWDHTQEMKGKPFYCINSDYNVYKCLSNNNGAPSTDRPSGMSLLPFTTSDGYIWKYMYNVPSFKRNKFLSNDLIPVQKALTDGFYNRGAVEQIVVADGGTGYIDVQQTTITISGGGGTGAVLIPIVSKETGTILDVIIQNAGSGYSTAPTLTLVSNPAGTGIYGNSAAKLRAIVHSGNIVNVTIEDPGIDYPADTSTTIVAIGDGTGAIFSPVVSGGVIIDVIVENPGQDYSFIELTVIGEGSGAVLNPVLAVSDFISNQAAVEQSADPGAIYAIKVTESGNNYDGLTTVTIEGDGTGATAVPVIVSGVIQKIDMTTYGTGYTYANVVIYNPNRELPNDYIDAEAYAILPPSKGHGYDAVNELYGDTMAVYTQLKDDEELTMIQQNYRQYGILVNPRLVGNNKRATNEKYFIMFDVNFNNTTGITPDTILISNNVKYRVVQKIGLNVKLQQLSLTLKPVSSGNSFYYEGDEGTLFVVTSVVSFPTVNKYSGDMLYVQNLEPFTPSEEQLLSFRTYITL